MNGLGAYLESLGVRVTYRSGWQSVKCPFHGDKSASASFNEQRGKFHCFGCGLFEDLIGLLMSQEGMSFEEAKREAEGKYGESSRRVDAEPLPLRGGVSDRARNKSGGGGKVPARRRLA